MEKITNDLLKSKGFRKILGKQFYLYSEEPTLLTVNFCPDGLCEIDVNNKTIFKTYNEVSLTELCELYFKHTGKILINEKSNN